MSANKKETLAVIVACVIVLTVWFAARSYQPLDYDHLPTKYEILADAYKQLKYLTFGNWYAPAFVVAQHGDPDEATDAIIDLIQNRETLTAENFELYREMSKRKIAALQGRAYFERLRVLTPLGLTRTERAEEFLLDAYNNPRGLIANQKYRQLNREQPASGYHGLAHDASIERLTSSWAMVGLLLLDEPKYSPVLDEEFDRLAVEMTRISRKDLRRASAEDENTFNRFGVFLSTLVRRDMIRERGTENTYYLRNSDDFHRDWGRFTARYWDTETNTAVARP